LSVCCKMVDATSAEEILLHHEHVTLPRDFLFLFANHSPGSALDFPWRQASCNFHFLVFAERECSHATNSSLVTCLPRHSLKRRLDHSSLSLSGLKFSADAN
jgi:hypothetical protein